MKIVLFSVLASLLTPSILLGQETGNPIIVEATNALDDSFAIALGRMVTASASFESTKPREIEISEHGIAESLVLGLRASWNPEILSEIEIGSAVKLSNDFDAINRIFEAMVALETNDSAGGASTFGVAYPTSEVGVSSFEELKCGVDGCSFEGGIPFDLEAFSSDGQMLVSSDRNFFKGFGGTTVQISEHLGR
jgi:hypothetical protein